MRRLSSRLAERGKGSGNALPRGIPSVERLLGRPRMIAAQARLGRGLLLAACREAASLARSTLRTGSTIPDVGGWIEDRALALAEEMATPSLRRVINATGILLHTNLGRAPISVDLIARAARRAAGYSNLELDLATGKRGSRTVHFQRCASAAFPGAAGLVVNNNAAAVLLLLNTLAAGRDVVVSRGELVEIGGSFRIPDICERSGARLVEVGTTNRTRISDYAKAIRETTAMLLRVHPSNFRVVGFTEEVDPVELSRLGRRRRIPVVADLGSATFADLPPMLSCEPRPGFYLRHGYSLICFSGDKLLGSCQAGIILGKPRLIESLRRNPLYRALRPDKLALAVLEESLLLLLRGRLQDVPLLRAALAPVEEIERRASAIATRIAGKAEVDVRAGESLLGGGASTDLRIPSALLSIRTRSISERAIVESLRRWEPSILARIDERHVLLDLRTVLPEEDGAVSEALASILGR